MVHLPQTIFFCKIINIILIYLLAPFMCKVLKKFFQWIQSYDDVQFLGPKWPISSKEIFPENLSMSLVFFIHAYLHAKNQTEIFIY